MDIMIAGYGFVGRAHEALLKKQHNVPIYDPNLGYGNWWKNPDGVIICVSTPEADDGSCDMSNVIDVINNINIDVPILIKSTVSLEGWRQLKFMFPNHKLAFSPEFLRAATAIEDFLNSRLIYIGGDSVSFWHALFRVAFNDSEFTTQVGDPEGLILAKYFRNAFLATKVNYFNQIHDLCESAGINPEEVLHVVSSDERIGHSHTHVSKERGFGGHCFPKDTLAILHTGETYGVDLTIIREAVEYNKRVRKE